MKNPIASVKEKVTDYVKLRIEEVKLTALEKAGKAAGGALLGLLLLFFLLLLFLFLGLGLSAYLGQLWHSMALGFLGGAAAFLLLILLIVLLAKPIMRMVARIIEKMA